MSSLLAHFHAQQDEIASWRRRFHAHPEILFDTHWTAEAVATYLRSFGVDHVETGIGRTGVVGVIKGQKTGPRAKRTIGLRADMDGLPIEERTHLPYASKEPGKMHACGHDGHMSMLLGAARYLSQKRDFSGTVVVIFQPAEEGGAGAKVMIDDGLMDHFAIDEVYGMHNLPGLPVGQFAMRRGVTMAATETFKITLTGTGGHAAWPHNTHNPIYAGAQSITALGSVLMHTLSPLESAVVNVTQFHAGTTSNVVPHEAHLSGTLRTLAPETANTLKSAVAHCVKHTAQGLGVAVDISFIPGYPACVNHDTQLETACHAAARVCGEAHIQKDIDPLMGGEDFAFMLEERPGAFIFVGNGDTPGLHHPQYDFNDAALAFGCAYWVSLASEIASAGH